MSDEMQRGSGGAAAANRLRGLKKARPASVVGDMVSDAPPEVVSALAQPELSEPVKVPEPVVHFAPEPVEPVVQVEEDNPAAAKPSEPVEPKKRKTGIFQTEEQSARLRNTFSAIAHHTEYRSMSEYAAAAIDEMNDRMEEKFNGGKPFPNKPNGVKAGRPPVY